ncbi:ATP-binding protein [Pseudomonas viridiflava]
MFEPFYSRGSDQGVGLGLAIVQKVALLLDGGVNLQNRTGGGLRASLKAPLG